MDEKNLIDLDERSKETETITKISNETINRKSNSNEWNEKPFTSMKVQLPNKLLKMKDEEIITCIIKIFKIELIIIYIFF